MLEENNVTRDTCIVLVKLLTNVLDPGSTFNSVAFDGMTVKLNKAVHFLLIVQKKKFRISENPCNAHR